ncbi:Uncharacterised protein [Burkholderia cenocepacia]|nr:Uncharacterised protein [Burkholderia cenocepacia]
MRWWRRCPLLPGVNPISSCRRTASRSARAGTIVWVAQCPGMSSASKTGMNTCARTVLGLLVVAARMRRSGRTMRRVVLTGRRIRSIRRCRSQRRGRFMTMDRGRSARLPVVRGRRGRLAILLGEVGFRGSGRLRPVYPARRAARRCAARPHFAALPFHVRDDYACPAQYQSAPCAPGTKHASLISHIPRPRHPHSAGKSPFYSCSTKP